MRQQPKGARIVFFLVGLVILAFLVMDFNSRSAELNRLTAEREVVRARATQAMETQMSLKAQIEYATSDAAAMRWAYEEGRMVRPGDNPVVPIQPAANTPVPTPTPAPIPTEEETWQRWFSLFFSAENQ